MKNDIKSIHKKIVKLVQSCGVERLSARAWIHMKNDIFKGKSPADLIKEGESGKVIRTIKQWRKQYESVEKTRIEVQGTEPVVRQIEDGIIVSDKRGKR